MRVRSQLEGGRTVWCSNLSWLRIRQLLPLRDVALFGTKSCEMDKPRSSDCLGRTCDCECCKAEDGDTRAILD